MVNFDPKKFSPSDSWGENLLRRYSQTLHYKKAHVSTSFVSADQISYRNLRKKIKIFDWKVIKFM